MTLSLVTREDALSRLLQQAGSVDSTETLSDLVRAEVHARKRAPRVVTLSRVARLLAPALAVDEERLDEIWDGLEREGDVVLAPGGFLYATPTRVVVLEEGARVFGSLPTRVLAAALGRDVSASGATRRVASTEGLAEAVAKISGLMVAPEVWAALDRAPNADAVFLAKLDQRLEWESSGAGSLEKDGALEWRTWEVTGDGARWRRSDEGKLWWARARFGGHHRAWTSGASPAVSRFIALSPDDADRARFALSREVAGASALGVQRAGERTILSLPGWLPRPEYRWLSLHAAPVAESKGTRWEVEADGEAMITKLLSERLGLVPLVSDEAR